jgi:glycosyltransferase involved in cell wall biosynthesis
MEKTLSIIVPVYNEENLVAKSLPAILNLQLNKEVIVVDDGSSDQTPNILAELQKAQNFLLKRLDKNQGKGAAVKYGLEGISGDYFIVCDADLEYDTEDISRLFAEAQKMEDDMIAIYGSRFKKNKNFSFHYFVNRLLTALTNILFKTDLTDMETCFKLIPSKALQKISLSGKRFEIEPEITARLLKAGYKIIEFPINYSRRGYEEGKKITALDGWLAVKTLIKEKIRR